MSTLASWSYTAQATLWRRTSQADGWGSGSIWAAPVVIACDYGATSKLMRDAKGDEFLAQLSVYTEHADARQGDMLAIGDHGLSLAPTPDAREIRVIERHADTFARSADDYTLITG